MIVNNFIDLCKNQIVGFYALNNVDINKDDVLVVW